MGPTHGACGRVTRAVEILGPATTASPGWPPKRRSTPGCASTTTLLLATGARRWKAPPWLERDRRPPSATTKSRSQPCCDVPRPLESAGGWTGRAHQHRRHRVCDRAGLAGEAVEVVVRAGLASCGLAHHGTPGPLRPLSPIRERHGDRAGSTADLRRARPSRLLDTACDTGRDRGRAPLRDGTRVQSRGADRDRQISDGRRVPPRFRATSLSCARAVPLHGRRDEPASQPGRGIPGTRSLCRSGLPVPGGAE